MSDNDPLNKWRKTGPASGPPETKEPAKSHPESAGYEAFNPVDASLYLKIRRPAQPTQRPYYEGLLNVIDDEPHGTNAVLVYSFGMVVIMSGRNLSEMVEAIARHQVEWIQAYDKGRWPLPVDKTKAFIEKIEIVVKDAAEGIADAERRRA